MEDLEKDVKEFINFVLDDMFNGGLETPEDDPFTFITSPFQFEGTQYFIYSILDTNSEDLITYYLESEELDSILKKIDYDTEPIKPFVRKELNILKEKYKTQIEKEIEEIKNKTGCETAKGLINYLSEKENMDVTYSSYSYWKEDEVPYLGEIPLAHELSDSIHHCECLILVENMSLRNAYRFLKKKFSI